MTATSPPPVTFGQAIPALTYATPTGFVNGDSASVISGTATLSTTATNTSAPGDYPITFSTMALAATNYSFNYVNGTLTISPVGAASSSNHQPDGRQLHLAPRLRPSLAPWQERSSTTRPMVRHRLKPRLPTRGRLPLARLRPYERLQLLSATKTAQSLTQRSIFCPQLYLLHQSFLGTSYKEHSVVPSRSC